MSTADYIDLLKARRSWIVQMEVAMLDTVLDVPLAIESMLEANFAGAA